jgi:hypothetical protein
MLKTILGLITIAVLPLMGIMAYYPHFHHATLRLTVDGLMELALLLMFIELMRQRNKSPELSSESDTQKNLKSSG